jgi:hypothetical protein
MYSKISAVGVLLLVILALGILTPDVKAIENMLFNPDFEIGLDGWALNTGGDSAGEAFIDPNGIIGNCMFCRIDATGPDPWEPEVHSPPFSVEMGKVYSFAFWAKTEPGATRELHIKFEQLDTWVGPDDYIVVTDQWEKYHLTAEMPMGSPPEVVIHIAFQLMEEDVWFDRFRVYEGVEVDIDIKPETLNVKSKGEFTASIDLPEGYAEEDVDIETVECEGAPALKGVLADDGKLIVKFDREDLGDTPTGETVELIVTGKLNDGTLFVGSDIVRVIGPGKSAPAKQRGLSRKGKLSTVWAEIRMK